MAYTDAPSVFKRTNLFVDISGEEKTGKSTLAMSARPVISIIDMNDGLDGVVQKVVKRVGPGKIKIARHQLPQHASEDDMRKEARETWARMLADVKAAALQPGSILFDSGTELYKLARYAEMGGLKSTSKKGRLDFEMVNTRMRGLFHLFHAHKANFIITHQVKEEWITKKVDGVEKSRTTGRLVNNGWEDTGYDIQIALRTEKRITVDDGLHFVATLRTCRFAPELEGTEFSSVADMFNLPYIMSYATDTGIEAWQ